MDNLEQQRTKIIERIKQVFPKNPPGKKKLKVTKKIPSSVGVENRRLEAMLDGKAWLDVIGEPSLVYNLTDVDHLLVITDDAYRYYLPALLVATLNNPSNVALYGLYRKLGSIVPRLSLEQVDVLIEYFEFQEQVLNETLPPSRSRERELGVLEDYLLHLLFFRDQLSEQKSK